MSESRTKNLVLAAFLLGCGAVGVVLSPADPGGFFGGMLIGAVVGGFLVDVLWTGDPAHRCRACGEALEFSAERCPRCEAGSVTEPR